MTNAPATIKHSRLTPWIVWLLATTFVIYQFSIQTSYAILNKNVQQDLQLSLVEVGYVASFYMWIFASIQFFGGPLLDALGARKVLLPAIGLVTLGTIIFGHAHNYPVLLLAQSILAMGSCVAFVGAGYLSGKWFGMAKFSVMFGLVQFASALFSAFNQDLVNWSIQYYSWRELAQYATYFGLGLFTLSWFWLKDPASVVYVVASENILKKIARGLVGALRVKHVWFCMMWGGIVLGCQLALGIVWAPKLLASHGISLFDANAATSMVWLGLAIGCLILPLLSERVSSRRWPALLGVGIQILALLGLIYFPLSLGVGMGLCLVFGIGNSSHMLAFASAAEAVKPHFIGAASSLVNGAMFIIGGFMISLPSHYLASSALTPHLFQQAFLPYVLLLVLAGVLIINMRETYPEAVHP